MSVSYDLIEKSGSSSRPYELFLFQGTGISYALTNAEEEITYLGNIYTPTPVTRTEAEQSSEVTSGQLKVTIPKDHPLAAILIPYLPSSTIAATIFASHYGDAETVAIFVGVIASARFTDECELTCNSAAYFLQRKIPQQLYQAQCDHIFCDAGCGAARGDHTFSGQITAIDSTGTILTIPAFASLPDPLRAGYIKVGDEYRMIVAQSGEAVTIISAIPGLLAGAACHATAGCNLDFESCAHYGRTISFLGFDLIPAVNPFDGSASVD